MPPSGHHAHRDRAGGFCDVNNSAIAAQRLRQRHAHVAVLDVDAHHGDGMQNIFSTRSDVLTISAHADPGDYYPFYTGYAHQPGAQRGRGLQPEPAAATRFGQRRVPARRRSRHRGAVGFAPQALVLPLGFDTYKHDPISVLALDLDADHVLGACVGALRLPTVLVQEGGYRVDAIGPALDNFLQGFLSAR